MSVMSGTLSYLKPPFWSRNATVSSSNVDSGYTASKLCNSNPGDPVRWTSGAMSASISNPSGIVDVIVVGHSNLQAGLTVTVEGDIHTHWTTPTVPGDGIPLNSFGLVGSPSVADSFVISVTGNAADVIIGDVAAGELGTIGLPQLDSMRFIDHFLTIEPQVDISSVLPYDKGGSDRTLVGRYILTNTEMEAVRDWYYSQRGLSRVSVIFIDPSVQGDARFVKFKGLEAQPIVSSDTASDRIWMATLTFEELPRSRW